MLSRCSLACRPGSMTTGRSGLAAAGACSQIADQVPLTIHGMAYVFPAVPAVGELVDAFIAALRTASVMQRGIGLSQQARRAEGPGDTSPERSIYRQDELSTDQLFAVLRGEPTTWLA